MHGVVTNIQGYSIHDGPGIRTVVFLKGCPLRCKWCSNPECQDDSIEIEFYASKCVRCGTCSEVCNNNAVNLDLEVKSGFKINRNLCNKCGECVKACPTHALKFVGEMLKIEDVLEKVKKDRYFYLVSQGGLTLSGGEPLYQFKFTRELLYRSYKENIHTAIETSGHTPWECFEEILPYLNLILYDIKHMNPATHRQGTGVSNNLMLSNLAKLSQSGIPLKFRIPLIPRFNLDQENITQTARFVSSLENVKEVNLMPFHQLGKDKYWRLSKDYACNDLRDFGSDAKSADKIKMIKGVLESYNLKVSIGG